MAHNLSESRMEDTIGHLESIQMVLVPRSSTNSTMMDASFRDIYNNARLAQELLAFVPFMRKTVWEIRQGPFAKEVLAQYLEEHYSEFVPFNPDLIGYRLDIVVRFEIVAQFLLHACAGGDGA